MYNAFGKHFLKQSDWYYFSCDTDQELQPQTEENIVVSEECKVDIN